MVDKVDEHPQCTILDVGRAARIDDTRGSHRSASDEASPAPVGVVSNDTETSKDESTEYLVARRPALRDTILKKLAKPQH